jgi:hypothetical protein
MWWEVCVDSEKGFGSSITKVMWQLCRSTKS